jgi:hypothetical protein
VSQYAVQSVADLVSASGLAHEKAVFGTTGGSRVSAPELKQLQEQIREVAEDSGYPEPGRPSRGNFDCQCALILHKYMDICPNEASQNGVWQFLSLVVVPDVVRWRFFQESERGTNPDRFLGGPRNVLRRLWWRAYLLGEGSESAGKLMKTLGEDEITQVFDRSSLAGNAALTQSLFAEAIRLFPGATSSKRVALLRDAPKRLLRLQSFVSFELLEPSDLDGIVREILGKSVAALKLSK